MKPETEIARLRADLEQTRWVAKELEKQRDAYKAELEEMTAHAKRPEIERQVRERVAAEILPAIEAEVTRLRDELEDAAAPVDDLREQLAAARERAERFQDERDSARDALAEVVWERDAARETAERWRYVQNRKKAARELTEAMDRAARRGQDRVPRRRTEQDGGIPNDAYTADDYPKGM